MSKKSKLTKQQKQEVCRILNLGSPQEKYKMSNILTDIPQKNIPCYIITLIDNTICINYGKYENEKFYIAHFSSADNISIYDDYKQCVFYQETTPVAYVPFK